MSREQVADGSGAMFDLIAPRYDILNRVMSFGTDNAWRRRAVDALEPPAGGQVLDLAAGTGDVGLLVAERHPDVHVTCADPSNGMLDVAERKVEAAGLSARFSFATARAEELPFDDDTFDGVTIAFGIRNVTDRPAGLREMARVTRPGGRVCILELTEPKAGFWGFPARIHIRHVVPAIGALLSRGDAYRYLQKSIAAFPPPAEFEGMMADAGLRPVRTLPMLMRVAHVFVGESQG